MTAFDDAERRIRAGTAEAFGRTYARICAYPVSLLLDAAGVGTAVKVLDVGTGTGTVAVAACARGATVTAVDADPDLVKLARDAAKDEFATPTGCWPCPTPPCWPPAAH